MLENLVEKEVIGNIYSTTDYDAFINILGNRVISEVNYRKLVDSMQEEQLMIPILVNEKMGVIDGQHRLEACKALGKPVYFYVVEGYGIDEVKRANLVSCNWSLDDYMNLHVQSNNSNYKGFDKLVKDSNLSVAQLIEIIATLNDRRFKTLKQEFENGTFKFTNEEEVIEFLGALNDFAEFEDYLSARFTKAFVKLYCYSEYDHIAMRRKLKHNAFRLKRRPTYHDYISLLVNDIYTFNNVNVHFRYDIHGRNFYRLG